MTTISDKKQAADTFALLWRTLLPDISCPDQTQFLIWCCGYSDELVQRGIVRAATKSRTTKAAGRTMTATDAIRYASGVMLNESRGVRNHEHGLEQSGHRPGQDIERETR